MWPKLTNKNPDVCKRSLIEDKVRIGFDNEPSNIWIHWRQTILFGASLLAQIKQREYTSNSRQSILNVNLGQSVGHQLTFLKGMCEADGTKTLHMPQENLRPRSLCWTTYTCSEHNNVSKGGFPLTAEITRWQFFHKKFGAKTMAAIISWLISFEKIWLPVVSAMTGNPP